MTRRAGIVAAIAASVRAMSGQEPGKQWATFSGSEIVANTKPHRMILSLNFTEALEIQWQGRSVFITPQEIMDALEDKPVGLFTTTQDSEAVKP